MEWISVKDRLPEESVQVLTLDTCDKYHIEYDVQYLIKFDDGSSVWSREHPFEMVTHWMPLPLPPQLGNIISDKTIEVLKQAATPFIENGEIPPSWSI